MGIPHQAFNCKRIILYAILVFSYFLFWGQAQAYDSLFIVENVKVDVTAENSVSAQNQAFETAQVKAFSILAKRMVDEAQVESVATPNSLTISSLVKDYEVTDEQLSAVRYIGTYTFRFREAAVSKFFSVSGVSFTNNTSKPLLIIPVFQKDGKNTLWSEGNLWMQAWGRSQLSGGLVPVEVPIGDLMDIADIDESQALSYERRKLDQMLARYNAKEAAIMIAVPDALLSGVEHGTSRAIGRLRISIYRTDRARAEHVQDLALESNGNETLDQMYDRGTEQAYTALQRNWKNKTLASAAQNQIFLVRVPFHSISQWVQIEKVLQGVAGLSDLSVLSMKKVEARLSFKFRGDEVHLRDSLSRMRMSLGQGYANGSSYKFTDHQKNDPEIIYDLIFGKSNNKRPGNFYQEVEPATGSNNAGVHTF